MLKILIGAVVRQNYRDVPPQQRGYALEKVLSGLAEQERWRPSHGASLYE